MAVIESGKGTLFFPFQRTLTSNPTTYEQLGHFRFDYTINTDEETLLSTCTYSVLLISYYTGYFKQTGSYVKVDFGFAYGSFDNITNSSLPDDQWTQIQEGHNYELGGATVTELKFHNSYGVSKESTLAVRPAFRVPKPNISFDPSSSGSNDSEYRYENFTVPINEAVICVPIKSSSFSSTSGFLDESIAITISKGRPVYLNTIEYIFGTKTGIIAEKTLDASIAWTIPANFVTEFGENEIQKTGLLTMKTYDTGQEEPIQESSISFTVYLPSSDLAPILNPTIADTREATIALTGDSNKIVRYESVVSYNINGSAVKGATLVTQKASNGDDVVIGGTGTFSYISTNVFNFLVVDNRDMGASASITLGTNRFVNYIKPSCFQTISMEMTGETIATANISIYGAYFNGSFGKTNNSLKVEIRYTQANGSMSGWIDITNSGGLSIDSESYSLTYSVPNLQYNKSYTFQSRVTDQLNTVSSGEYVFRKLPIFDWSETDFNFNVPVNVEGNITMPKESSIGIGNTALRESGNTLTISADNIVLDTNSIDLGGVLLSGIEAGTWTPTFTNSSAISSYTTQTGWYQKIGNIVSVGFNVTAVCNNGYTGTGIALSGLPYTPAQIAFGGGVCSKTYVAAGFNFQCWAVETNGEITARVQQCNNVSNAALTTSASGCYYGSKDTAITVGGTITYSIQ